MPDYTIIICQSSYCIEFEINSNCPLQNLYRHNSTTNNYSRVRPLFSADLVYLQFLRPKFVRQSTGDR